MPLIRQPPGPRREMPLFRHPHWGEGLPKALLSPVLTASSCVVSVRIHLWMQTRSEGLPKALLLLVFASR